MNLLMLFSRRLSIKATSLAMVVAWGLPLLSTGCVISRNLHGASSTPSGGSNDFSISVSPSTLTIAAGGTADATVAVTFTVNNDTVNLSVTGLPAGATSSLSIMAANGATHTATMSIMTSANTPVGTTTFTVGGTDSKNQTQNQTVTLDVTAAGAAAAATAPACAMAVAGGEWKNAPFIPQEGIFTTTFEATPSAASLSAAIGLSHDGGNDGAGLAVLSSSGLIQARNGPSGELTPTDIPYAAGQTYRFRLVVDAAAHTYSAFVTPPGGTELTLGTDLALPNGQNTNDDRNSSERSAVERLDTWGVHVDDPADNISRTGTLTVCNFAVQ